MASMLGHSLSMGGRFMVHATWRWILHALNCQGSSGKSWVVLKIMAAFGVLSIIRHRVFRGFKKGTIILTTTQLARF